MRAALKASRNAGGQATYPRWVQQSGNWSKTVDALVAAFPAVLAGDVRSVLAIMPAARYSHIEPFPVEVQDETVTIPSRIFHGEPNTDDERALTDTQRVILHCLYSRHSDGWVRQRHVERVVGASEPWVAPFVVQLAGEYVVEVVEAICRGLPGLWVAHSPERGLYGEFIVGNPSFFARTEQRMVSYWSCYHRWKYPHFGTYPGGVLAKAFRAAASERAGTPWPRHTPRR